MTNIISNLNKAFDSRVRLGIMSILSVNESADFNTMKELMELTDGNLASHLKALGLPPTRLLISLRFPRFWITLSMRHGC